MLKRRHLLSLFLVTLLAVVGAVILVGSNAENSTQSSGLFAPDLLGKINEVSKVTVTTAKGQFHIKNSELGWHIPSQDNYRADAGKLHKLLVGLASLKRVEAKTRKKELYAVIGVSSTQKKASKAVAITLADKSGATLLDVLIGERRAARADPSSEELYVRIAGDPQSWLVEGVLPATGPNVSDWLDKRIALLNATRLRQTQVTHQDGEIVTAFRNDPKDRNFSYRQLPVGRELADEWRMNDLGRFLANLDSQGVYAKAKAPSAKPMVDVEIHTFDGLKISLHGTEAKDGSVYAELSASFDEQLVNTGREFKNENLKAADQVHAELELLNRRWSGWVYRLPKFKADYLRKRQADLLKKQS